MPERKVRGASPARRQGGIIRSGAPYLKRFCRGGRTHSLPYVEENNEEAGEHFTPGEVVRPMANLIRKNRMLISSLNFGHMEACEGCR